MPWRVERNKEMGFIEMVYTGQVTMKDVQDSTAEALFLVTEDEPHLFLADLSNAQSKLSVVDIYEIPNQWEVARAHRNNRLVVIVPEGAATPADSQFYEDVANNRGWNVRVFKSRPVAIEWLLN